MLLKDVWIDAPHRHGRLTLFRLIDPEGRTLPYRLMSEALEAGTLRIEEVDEWGTAQSARLPGRSRLRPVDPPAARAGRGAAGASIGVSGGAVNRRPG